MLRVRKVEMPAHISKLAARLVVFSPDTRLLCIITPESQVFLAKIMRQTPSSRDVKVMPSTLQLRRPKRRPDSHARNPSVGELGAYYRTINRVAFSADGSILVVGDLSGHLDSWVEGFEYISPEGEDEASSTSESEDDDDGDVDRKVEGTRIFFGQHWVPNPSRSLLPVLPSAPSILSFRPRPIHNGASGHDHEKTHSDHDDAHPQPQDDPGKEDRLFVLTANHQAFEFEMLRGKLSSWSRRNPSSYFSDEFKGLRDRAMGCIWDMTGRKERIWIYASTWLCMFDLSQDFAPDTQTHKGKRKRKRARISEDGEDLRAHTSGAGSKIPQSELSVTLGKRMRKFEGENPKQSQHITLDPPAESHDEHEDDVPAQRDLVIARRGAGGHAAPPNGDAKLTGLGPQAATENQVAANSDAQSPTMSFWCTHRYRSILGIVPISQPDTGNDPSVAVDDQDERTMPLEVAVIERPLWDLDLPPRFYGDQDRET